MEDGLVNPAALVASAGFCDNEIKATKGGILLSQTFRRTAVLVAALIMGSAAFVAFAAVPKPPALFLRRGPLPGEISLSWTLPATDSPITGYRIYRGNSSASQSHLADVGITRSFVDSGLPYSATFYYKVSATNASGEGPASPVKSELAPSSSVPQSITYSRGPNPGQIRIAWSSPASFSSPVTGFRIYRREASGPFTIIEPGNVLYYEDTGLKDATAYYYSIAALNTEGEGVPSGEQQVYSPSPPSEPQNIEARPGIGTVELFWTRPHEDGATAIVGYNIYKGFARGSETLLQSVPYTHRYSDPSCPVGTICFYYVRGLNLVGEGARSATVFMVGTGLPA